MKISIIITAFNEQATIEACLQALHDPPLPPGTFEMIVVDNGSTDRTASLARSFSSPHPVHVISQQRTHVSAARNTGAAAATGEIIGFIDGDCIARPGWIEQTISLAGMHTVWGAHYLVPLDATWVGRTWFSHQATQREGAVSFIPASCLFLHRADFERIGGFDPNIETAEDVEFCNRARANGMHIVAHRALSVYHEGTPRTLTHFYRQNRWHGKHVLGVFLANWPSTRDLPLVAVTFYTLFLFWITIICAVVALFTQHWLPFLISLILFLLPPLLLALAKTIRSRRILDTPPLFVLYLTYLLARSAAFARVLLGVQRRTLESTRARS